MKAAKKIRTHQVTSHARALAVQIEPLAPFFHPKKKKTIALVANSMYTWFVNIWLYLKWLPSALKRLRFSEEYWFLSHKLGFYNIFRGQMMVPNPSVL